MQPNLPTYLLSCKRVHFFGDKHYKLYVTDYEMIISESKDISKGGKYQLSLQLKNTVYWNFRPKNETSELGLMYKGKIKFFKAQYDALIQLKSTLANKIMFQYVVCPFTKGTLIGEGSNCKVYASQDQFDGTTWALKMGLMDDNLMSEIRLMNSLNHQNVVKQKEILMNGNQLIVVQELMKGRSLKKMLKETGAINKADVKSYMKQLLKALSYIHQQGLVHRDIKPDNIMFKDSKETIIKLIDFGYAGFQADEVEYMFGTYGYFAPECLDQSENQSSKSDIYSAGCVFYEMLTGYKLFSGSTKEMIKYRNEQGMVELSHSRIDPIEADLLSRMLNDSPQQRIAANIALQHDYFIPDATTPSLQKTGVDIDVNSSQTISKCVMRDDSIKIGQSPMVRCNPIPSRKIMKLMKSK